jgi:acetylornithine/N-succinyldiaminopimelate aminotransferase
MGALAATPREHYQAPYRPLLPGVVIAEYNNLASARAAVSERTCAIIVEPIEGEGGILPATAEFLQGLRELCNERHLLLICDEVQCGLGRSGTLWAYEQSGIKPDVMTIAKPLAGGLPMGATLVTEDVASAIAQGDHGSTFAAGPLVSSVAQVVMRRVSQPSFLAHVREVGEYLGAGLRRLAQHKPIVSEVRGRGLMWAIELTEDAAPYVTKGYEQGVIMTMAGQKVLRLLPPLVIQRQHVDDFLAVLDGVLPGGAE